MSFSPEEIEIKIKVKFRDATLYHIIVDEQGDFVSEGWFPTLRGHSPRYTVKMKVKKEYKFKPGIKYRLCINRESPEYVARYRDSYKCIVDYEFMLRRKKP